ncbi:hypothetical protein [Nocardia sp. NPDC058705]|uniref:hypothetical protein n=1 Tax=Nocardia sp. NPDC058705 TaxID=3346609 RepID=UPI0036BB5747
MPDQNVTQFAKVVEILDTVATLTDAQRATAGSTEPAATSARASASELISLLYAGPAAGVLTKAVEEAVAPLELAGKESAHLTTLASDAGLAVLLVEQDAGHDIAGTLSSPWKSVLG